MDDWLREAENTIRAFYKEHVGNPDDLAMFRLHGDRACEIVKKDGSRTVIDRKTIETGNQDRKARAVLIKKLKTFSYPPMQWIV